jgi:outer membrane immunogenic protein
MDVKRLMIAAVVATAGLPAAAQDWAGFYGGLSANNAEFAFSQTGVPFDYTAGDLAVGAFVGYNWSLGTSWVASAELTYADTDLSDMPVNPYMMDSQLAVRGRIGYAMGNVLPYLAVGAAQSEFMIFGAPFSTDETGLLVGLGTEFMLGDKTSLRAEYSVTTYDGVGSPDYWPSNVADGKVENMSIGVAWHF